MWESKGTRGGDRVMRIALEPGSDTRRKARQILSGLEEAGGSGGSRNIRCVLISGGGNEFLRGHIEGELRETWERELKSPRVPVILAVGGACGGIGRELLDCADLAVAADGAVIEGFRDAAEAAEACAVNETVEAGELDRLADRYVNRLLEIPEELIAYGHKIYFAMEQLPDKLSRSRYGATVIGEIMEIQARLNRKLREATGEQDPYSGVQPDEEICYERAYDRDHAVLFEVRDDVAYIRLNAPRYRNMFDWRSSMELAGAYAVANSIPTLKAIVVTGTGKRFHLGGIRHDQEDAYEQERFADQLRIRNQIMRQIKVPLIAAVNGECSGGGMSLVLKSQIAIAAESARFGYPEVKHNGFACNSMVNTMGIIPKKAALKSFYFGDLFSAREALKFGIVKQVVPDEELKRAVEAAVRRLPARA